ncbi:MAG: Ppx/GppA phosphatase family protein [Pseudomonadota bacterium]
MRAAQAEAAVHAVGRRMGDGAVGVVDVGSNSVRLVLYERASRAPTVLFNEKVLAGLGGDLAEHGRLSDEAMARALAAISRFMAVARAADADELTIVATAAARVAANGPDFIAQIEALTGVSVRVLAGREEAEMAGRGVLCGFWRPDGVVGDLGGGSLELIDVADDRLGAGESFELGTLRLMGDAKGDISAAREIAARALKGSKQLPLLAGRSLYAVGGTWRSLVRLHMATGDHPIAVMHHYGIPASEMAAFCDALLSEGLEAFAAASVVSKNRRALLPWGAAVLRELLEVGRPSEVVASSLGVREGLIYHGLSQEERGRDPLLLACAEIAVLRARSPKLCAELVEWTADVFAAVGIRESEDEVRLRGAACFLSDIGWRAHPDYRGDQAIAVISNVGLYGVDHPGRGYLAAAVLDRYGGFADGASRPAAEALCPPRFAQRAKVLAAAFKVAYVVAPGVAGILPRTRVVRDGDHLALELPGELGALEGERPRRRMRNLAKLLNLKGSVIVR